MRARSVQLRNTGATLSPLAAFQLLQGLETCRSASSATKPTPGRWPTTWPTTPGSNGSVSPAFPTTPITPWSSTTWGAGCRRSSPSGWPGATTAGLAFFDSLNLFKRLLNLGDAKSLAIHPASTTHRQLSDQERAAAGIRPETIRLSIGLEHIDDIIDDLDQALATATR